ncbi:MAG: sensor domain-containing diguanylate cyclase [Bacilli bacterium]
MKYSNLSKEELIAKLEEVEILNEHLIDQRNKEDTLDYSWSGNLGHWYWNIKTNNVTFNPIKVTNLGYDIKDLPKVVNYQYFTEKLHPEDYQVAMDAMMDHLYKGKSVYEVEYRIRDVNGNYKWYYDRGKITKRDENNKPLFLAGIVFDVTERKQREENIIKENLELSSKILLDPLTNLNNRQAVNDKLKEEITKFKEDNKNFCLIMLDIDHFKTINDNYGHNFGDQVIVEVSKIMKSQVRDIDMVARYGGEEFMIILTNTDIKTARVVANRIREKIAHNDFAGKTITISGGVSQFHGETILDFIEHTDSLLYQAKKTGRNKIV